MKAELFAPLPKSRVRWYTGVALGVLMGIGAILVRGGIQVSAAAGWVLMMSGIAVAVIAATLWVVGGKRVSVTTGGFVTSIPVRFIVAMPFLAGLVAGAVLTMLLRLR